MNALNISLFRDKRTSNSYPQMTIHGKGHILGWLLSLSDYGQQEAGGYGFNSTSDAGGAGERYRRQP